MEKRALRIAVPVVVVCLVAGSIFAFFAGSGSLGGGEWKTAAGVSLPLPTDGAPRLTNSSGSDLDVTLAQTGGSSLSTGSVSIPAGASSSDSFTEDVGGGQGHGTVSAAGAVGPGQATASLTS